MIITQRKRKGHHNVNVIREWEITWVKDGAENPKAVWSVIRIKELRFSKTEEKAKNLVADIGDNSKVGLNIGW